MAENNGLIRATGLWKKVVEKNGKKTVQLSGTWGGVRVLIFANDRKERDSQPDYYLMLAKQQPRQQSDSDEREPGDVL